MIRISPSAAAITSAIALAVLSSALPAHAQGGPGFAPPAPTGGPQLEQQQAGDIEQFRQVLQQYGQFQQHPRYGEVWTPAPGVTPPGWRPYPPCHWIFDRQQQAWFYNDQTPWGQIVHHHGRWANDPQLGWMWIGDANFGPGWVVWRADAQSVSWAAMLPEQDGQQQPPADHWHTQDTRTFNAGCRQAAPAPVASLPPVAPVAPIGRVARVGGPLIVGTPGIVLPPPVVIPPRPCHRIWPRPWWCRPIVRPPPRPCHLIFPRPHWCRPIVRPNPRPCIMIYPRPSWCGGVVRPFPRPGRPIIVRPGRPLPPIVRPGRPGRPGIARPFPGRPGITRPFPGRPGIARPFPGRPGMTRPIGGNFRPQLGGGFRPGGGIALRGGRR